LQEDNKQITFSLKKSGVEVEFSRAKTLKNFGVTLPFNVSRALTLLMEKKEERLLLLLN